MSTSPMECQDWSLPRSDSFAQRQWGTFLVEAQLTQQQVVDMDGEKFKELVEDRVKDPVLKEQIIGRREDLWNQYFGFDSSGRRASVATSGMRGVEVDKDTGVADGATQALSRKDSLVVLCTLWEAFLTDAKLSEQDAMALSDAEFGAKLREHRGEDPVLVARLSGHRQDLWNEYFGFETRKGSMCDMKVRRASVSGDITSP
eukprot:TRINITY_DN16560_c0_g1_i1.p4 TRINITY_DN16560_c0_g1~~TRINITY_DN16560_c0_g1_i1.p4  ORF type:complete len:202 (+),score=60.99 TRINITY_DN16560_c0_g1_i1:108-713(+)